MLEFIRSTIPAPNPSLQGRSLWWKVFAVLFALITLRGAVRTTGYEELHSVVSLALDTMATIGLFLFAFSKRFLSRRFWKFFTVIYIVYCVADWLAMIPKWLAEHQLGTFATVFVISCALALQLMTMLALWRYSTQADQTIEAGPMAAHVPPPSAASAMPIRGSAHSDFPHVYRAADRSFYWAMTIILGTAAVYFSVVFGRDLL